MSQIHEKEVLTHIFDLQDDNGMVEFFDVDDCITDGPDMFSTMTYVFELMRKYDPEAYKKLDGQCHRAPACLPACLATCLVTRIASTVPA